MAKEYTDGFYTSSAWTRCRQAFIADRIATDGGLCQVCKRSLGYIVHHKVPITPQTISDTDVTLNHSNLMFVCIDCHNKLHGDMRCILTADGEVIPIAKNL
jgi:5-methylcytosine-specific restriction enzyme A